MSARTEQTDRPEIENARVIMTERNLPGQIVAEYEIERVYRGDRIVQETVRETRYLAETGGVEFERRAVDPDRARNLIRRAETGGMLDRWT